MPTYALFAAYLDQVEKAVSSLEVASDRLSEILSHLEFCFTLETSG